MNHTIKSIFIFILFSTSIVANDNNDSNISKDAIFSLNKKVYEQKDFPPEYQELSKRKKAEFISSYIYYTLLGRTLEKETQKYQSEIKNAIKKRKNDLVKKGIILTKLEKIILDKKIVTDTVGYNHILKKHKNIAQEIKEFYTKNKEGYKLPNRVEVSHIVVKDENLSKKLIKELNEKDDLKLFSKYAREYSVNKSTKYNGGYVGNISSKKVEKEFFDAIWSGKEKSLISKPLKSNEYFHIVYLFKKNKAEQRKLEDEKESIEQYLLKKEIKKWEKEIIFKLKKESEIVYY